MKKSKNSESPNFYNNATRIITSVIGLVLALSGMTHGVYEILQGNSRTSGLIIQAISPEFQRWPNGEEAFTLIPNYLITGIAAIIVGILIIVWSLRYVHRKYGQSIFLILFILLTMVGGGLGFIIFYLITWGYSTRINKELKWWNKVMNHSVIKGLSNIWLASLVIASLGFILGLFISVYGIPGKDYDTILAVCWGSLLIALIFLNITYVAGFSYDIEQRNS